MALAKGGFEVPLKTFTLRLVFRRRQKKKPPPPVGFYFETLTVSLLRAR